jgi:hypothetical protein
MMNHSKILRRALDIVLKYKVLWLFGVLAALGAGSFGNGGGSGYRFNGSNFGRTPGFTMPPGTFQPNWGPLAGAAGIAIVVILGLILLAIVIGLAFFVLRFVSETALIRLVDDFEATGEKRGVGRGFRFGWSMRSLRLFAIDLVVGIPVAIAFVLLFLLALSPLLLWATGNNTMGGLGTVATIGLVILIIVLAILVALAISLLKPFFWRKAVLEDRGVFASIGEGYRMVRRHLRDSGLMWLMLVGLQIAYGLVMIPVAILLLILATVIAGVPALVVARLAALTMTGAGPAVLGLLVGLPIWIVLFFAPLLFVGGLWEAYKSSAWTLTYRELRALESVTPTA